MYKEATLVFYCDLLKRLMENAPERRVRKLMKVLATERCDYCSGLLTGIWFYLAEIVCQQSVKTKTKTKIRTKTLFKNDWSK